MPTLYGEPLHRTDLLKRVGRLGQVAGIRFVTLGDGSERGVRILEVRTGSGFSFDILVDRAFDVGRCEFKGQSLAWESSVGFAGPWYYEAEHLGFLRSFAGGLLTTCGLDHTLFPTEDTAQHYHYPPKATEKYGLHGRISNRPAKLVGYGEQWQGDECVLWAEGEVQQTSSLGENLVLRRRIETSLGSSRLVISDVVENVGYHLTPHMLLYHVNLGFPVVDEGSEILLPATKFQACGDYSSEGFRTLSPPLPNYEEQVFEYDPNPEPDGTVPVAIVNEKRKLGVYQLFQKEQLPHPFVWRMLGEGSYVVALEPSTNRVAGRHDARKRGELITLNPGETRQYTLELGVLEGHKDIEQFRGRVERLQ
jgi:hypothetical protein